MDNYVEKLKTRIEELYKRIERNKDALVVYNLIKKGKSKYQHIFSLTGIINRNMQCGNYKRAAKYYFFANSLIVDVEKNHKEIKDIITTYMLKEGAI